eukprot:818385-Prorocentrum_minimum.AAC.1
MPAGGTSRLRGKIIYLEAVRQPGEGLAVGVQHLQVVRRLDAPLRQQRLDLGRRRHLQPGVRRAPRAPGWRR